jgi:hypothetical protein
MSSDASTDINRIPDSTGSSLKENKDFLKTLSNAISKRPQPPPVATEAPVSETPPTTAITKTADDLSMKIELFKRVTADGSYQIYVANPVDVSYKGIDTPMTIPNANLPVYDSSKPDDKVNIDAIIQYINTSLPANASRIGSIDGGYSSKSVSFRPVKKRRTVKKHKGRK